MGRKIHFSLSTSHGVSGYLGVYPQTALMFNRIFKINNLFCGCFAEEPGLTWQKGCTELFVGSCTSANSARAFGVGVQLS